jgi:hypothetical protein
MDGGQKEQGSHALVEVCCLVAEALQPGAGGQQFGRAESGGGLLQWRVALALVAGGDDPIRSPLSRTFRAGLAESR